MNTVYLHLLLCFVSRLRFSQHVFDSVCPDYEIKKKIMKINQITIMNPDSVSAQVPDIADGVSESTKASTTEVQTIPSRKTIKTNAQRCREYRERKKLQNTMVQNLTAERSDECQTDQLPAKKPKTNAERRKKHYEAQKLKKQGSKKIPKTAKQRNKEYYDRKKQMKALNHHSDARTRKGLECLKLESGEESPRHFQHFEQEPSVSTRHFKDDTGITDDKTMQLIDLYSKEDCLWNTKVEDYKNREKRQLAADKIATILDLPNFTAKHVMMKFKNLRNSYSQELKKIAQSLNTGATGDDVYTPKVFWFPKMDSFIKPHIQGKPQKDDSLIYGVNETQPPPSIEWIQVDSAEQYLNPEISLAEASASEDERSNRSRKRQGVQIKVPTKKTRSELPEPTLSNVLQDVQSHLHVLVSQNNDYLDSFGKYVASLMKSLPLQKALEVQPQIVSLITRSLIESGEVQAAPAPAVAVEATTSDCHCTHEVVIKMDPDEYD